MIDYKYNIKGFTFIELLVVITIISILATIGTISFSDALKKARSAKIQADIKTLESSLAIYFYKKGDGSYPTKGVNAVNQDAENWETFQLALGASSIVHPKTKNGGQYCYYVDNRINPSSYILVATDFETIIPVNASNVNLNTMYLIATSNDSNGCLGIDGTAPICAERGSQGGVGVDYCVKSAPPIEL